MHKQSFTEYHSLATKASWVRPSLHFSSKLPEVETENPWRFQLTPQGFKQKAPEISVVNPWSLFSYNPDYTINAATSAKIA